MSPETQKVIWAEIRKVGDSLVDRLPPSSNHPNGRNPYAHVASSIKEKYGCSYKDIPEELVSQLRMYLQTIDK